MNDHQVEFAKAVSKRMGTIIPVIDIEELGEKIINYDRIVASMHSRAGIENGLNSNNTEFCRKLEEMVDEIMK